MASLGAILCRWKQELAAAPVFVAVRDHRCGHSSAEEARVMTLCSLRA